MKGEAIPDSDHVARYCKGTSISNGEIQATAFMMRETDQYLSVNWMEVLNRSDRLSEICELQLLYSRKFNRVGATARIAVLNVGAVRAKIKIETSGEHLLPITHEPETDDPSHAGIYGIPHDNELVAELIAQVVLESHSAKA
jgi:hypothetical protein